MQSQEQKNLQSVYRLHIVCYHWSTALVSAAIYKYKDILRESHNLHNLISLGIVSISMYPKRAHPMASTLRELKKFSSLYNSQNYSNSLSLRFFNMGMIIKTPA